MLSEDPRADNLLSRLFSYTPRDGRTPLEDYCTEALAWCLRQSPALAQGFLALTGIPTLGAYRGQVTAATQESFKASDDEDEEEGSQSPGGRFDLVICPADSNDFVLVVESKVFSGFRLSQLEKYQRQLDNGRRFEDVARDRRFLVALTDHAARQPLDQAGGRLRWSKVCQLLERFVELETADPKAQAKASLADVCKQFAAFLKEKGMSLSFPKSIRIFRAMSKGYSSAKSLSDFYLQFGTAIPSSRQLSAARPVSCTTRAPSQRGLDYGAGWGSPRVYRVPADRGCIERATR